VSTRRRQKNNEAARADLIRRITKFEEAITKGNEYLASGEHAHWRGFRPLFVTKTRDGKELPPHRDWVRVSSEVGEGLELGGASSRKTNAGETADSPIDRE
jgi:hypothetical protein